MKWTAITRHRAGTTFVLIFFLTFALLSGALLVQSVRVYRSIDRRADDTHSTAIPLTYLSGAARRADTENGLDIVIQPDGAHALRAREQGKTWLYLCRDGYLYKQIEGKPAETAERLCKAGSLRLRRVNGVIRADYTAPNGSRSTLLLGLRAAGGVS
ncbi:MAG: hypothetical protein KH050_08730 [Clostridiaceae bacterium]|nr:hypothetical protein [Clostridiaceae bacterium]